MRRREFIALAGGAAAAWPLAARAQQPGKLPTIGFLGADAAGWRPWTDAFLKRLRELGWIDGQTIAIEYRWTEGHPERVAEIAAEFVRRKVDLIVAYGIAVPTLKQATAVIPIVFAIAQDPVGGGLVASLARPGGNVTGLSLQDSDVAGKRLELLREIVPSLRRLAILTNIGSPQAASETGEVHAAARKLGLEIVPLEIRRAEDIGPAFEGIEFKPTHFTSWPIQSLPSIAIKSSRLRSARGCRQPSTPALMSKAGVSCPMDPTFRIYSDALPSWSTRFCTGRNPAISRSSSRPNSSWRSISRLPKRLASPFRHRCSSSPTR